MRNQKIKVLIVDDEEHAIQIIRLLLVQHSDVEIVATATNGYDAIQYIGEYKPELVFLDIQMPEVSGFDVIRQMAPVYQPYYIFTTAYDQYAVAAFEINTLDYLLKPFTDARFHQALDRARTQISYANTSELAARLEALISDREQSGRPTPILKIPVRIKDKTIFIDTNKISWIEADNQYIKIHTTEKTYLVREALASIEDRLDTLTFYRVHRSAIINVQFVEAIAPHFKGDSIIHLMTGAKVKLSRNRKKGLQVILGW